MAIPLAWTYDTLKTAIQSYVEDTGTDLVAHIDEFIGIAELRVLRDLDLELEDTNAEPTLTATVATLAKTTGLLRLRSFGIIVSSSFQPLSLRSLDYINQYWPNDALTGVPLYIADFNETTWKIAPTPDNGYVARVRYIARPDGLSDTVATTWLGTHVPDLLLSACVAEAERFLNAHDLAAVWDADYRGKLEAERFELRRSGRADYWPVRTASRSSGTGV